jgi:hypothetical protein
VKITYVVADHVADIESDVFDFYEILPEVITDEIDIKPLVLQARKGNLNEE